MCNPQYLSNNILSFIVVVKHIPQCCFTETTNNIFIKNSSKQTNDELMINIVCISFFFSFVWFFELWASSNCLNSIVSIVNEKKKQSKSHQQQRCRYRYDVIVYFVHNISFSWFAWCGLSLSIIKPTNNIITNTIKYLLLIE